jgi:hypothetical protein
MNHDRDDHAEATPRERDTGQGYPEESQPGTGIDARDHPEDDLAPSHDAPETSTDEDGDPSQATGNPKAAGGQ